VSRGRRCESSRSCPQRSASSAPLLFSTPITCDTGKPVPQVSRLDAPMNGSPGSCSSTSVPSRFDPEEAYIDMTALISWVGYDSRVASSLYFASDSRISILKYRWDHGRKLFALRNRPEIFGYCGDVLLPSQALGQLSSMLEKELLIRNDSTLVERTQAIRDFISASVNKYPRDIMLPFTILYAVRTGIGTRNAVFSLYRFDCDAPGNVVLRDVELPRPHELFAIGTGAESVQQSFTRWSASDVSKTSRAAFSAFADALRSRQDPNTGGPPQLAALYNGVPNPVEIGVLWDGNRYLNGAEILPSEALNRIPWRNELFELCDGFSGQRRTGAQPQPRPGQLR
jgi:hypothetical protein